jgi:hypothetical protein
MPHKGKPPKPPRQATTKDALCETAERARAFAESPVQREIAKQMRAFAESPEGQRMREIGEKMRAFAGKAQLASPELVEQARRAAETLRRDIDALRGEKLRGESPPLRAKNPGGRPPRDYEPAKQWLRRYIRVNGRAGQKALVEAVRDIYFKGQDDPPHDKTIEINVVRPVWRKLAKPPR